MIFNHRGRVYIKSDEIYTVIKNSNLWVEMSRGTVNTVFPIGTQLRLISGIEDRNEPGWHPSTQYFTVCREKVEFEQLGIEKDCLEKGPVILPDWVVNFSDFLDAKHAG